MSEPESTALSLITDAVGGMPETIKVPFFKALSELLGGVVAIPAAKLKQYAKAIEDTTAARSMAAGALAKAAVDDIINDPELLKVAADIYLPSNLRKAKNRLSVAQSSAEHLATAAASTNGEGATSPEDDWMNRFTRLAEDASSEHLQDLFGRILAGQILRPGAFGLATIRILSELDQSVANDFTQAWAKGVGSAVDYSPYWQRGDGFSRWKRLSEAGLMAPASTSQSPPAFKPVLNELSLWSPINADNMGLLVLLQKGSESRWDHIDFTRAGRELGHILEKPNYEDNLRQAAHRLPRHKVTRIDFFRNETPAEVIWQAPS